MIVPLRFFSSCIKDGALEDRSSQDPTRSISQKGSLTIEQFASHLQEQGDSPVSPNLSESQHKINSEENSSGCSDSEATEAYSCNESVSGESIYSSTEEEDFDLCLENLADLHGDEGEGEVNSFAKETGDSSPTGGTTGQTQDGAETSQAQDEVCDAAPTGEVSGATSEDQVHDTLPQADEDATTGPVQVTVPLCQHGRGFQSMCIILLLVAMVIIVLATGFTRSSLAPDPAITSVIPNVMTPAPLTDTRSLSPGICSQPEKTSSPGALAAHIAQTSLYTSVPKPEISQDTSIAVVYRFDFDVCKVTLPQSEKGAASILPEVRFSLPLPPLDTPARQPPSHIAITSLALLVPTYESVHKSSVAAARARINWGDHPSGPYCPGYGNLKT